MFGGWALALLLGCNASVEPSTEGSSEREPPDGEDATEDATGTPGSATAACTSKKGDVAPSPLRRLSNLELQLTLQDLFQLAGPPSLEGIPLDTDKEGFKTFAEVQPISAQHLGAYTDKARELADALLIDTARRRKVLGCEPSESGCLRGFVSRFGGLAYRRPLDATELDGIVTRAQADALDSQDQFRFALQLMLTSSNFLLRVEIGERPEGLAQLSPSELAAKLSFALWGRAPSAELLAQAAAGELATERGLRQTAAQMLDDERTQQFYGAFFRQWLGYDTLRAPVMRPAGWSDGLLTAMQDETDALTREYAFGSGSLLDALTTNQTRLTPELARFYGLPAPQADGNVVIPESHARANTGLLTHASLLSAKSDGDLIAIRGNWLRRTFLCSTLEIPPEVAEELGELLVGLTRVEIVKKRNSERSCKGCHSLIDPIGVGLAQFDAAGRWDDKVDITTFGLAPALPGAPEPGFESMAELSAKLQALPEVSACLTEKVFLYMNGRASTEGDHCTVDAAASSFAKGGHRFRALLENMVGAPSFRLRRAPPAP